MSYRPEAPRLARAVRAPAPRPLTVAAIASALALVAHTSAAIAQDASVGDASVGDASASSASSAVAPLALAPEVAAAFPLDVSSRRAQRTVAVVRASIATMVRCSSEFSYMRVIAYESERCTAAWSALEPTMREPTFAAGLVAMIEASTPEERHLLAQPGFANPTWIALHGQLVAMADASELPPSFVAFALRATAAVPAPSPMDFVVRDLLHLLDRVWGYDPSPVAPWGDASLALGTPAQRAARLRRLSEFALAQRGPSTRATDAQLLEQSRRDLTSAELPVRWRALQRLLRRRSMREVHREAVSNLQALWRERASLSPEARAHINSQIGQHMAYWSLPQTRTGGFAFEPRR